jgi:hypothetical protein
MKFFACLVFATVAACSTTSNDCVGNDCQCAAGQSCMETCAPGTPCHVQCAPNEPCDVACVAGQNCHVECSTSTSCKVDCAAGTDCHVTCPPSGCTVRDISAVDTEVTCGNFGEATITGTTATCP